MKLVPKNCTSKLNTDETPFADTVYLRFDIKGRRVSPSISPQANRPLTPKEIRFAIRIADYAARMLS